MPFKKSFVDRHKCGLCTSCRVSTSPSTNSSRIRNLQKTESIHWDACLKMWVHLHSISNPKVYLHKTRSQAEAMDGCIADWPRAKSLQWRHNDHDGVSNHQLHGWLLKRLFWRRSKKTSKLRVTGLCVGNSPGPVNSPHKGPVTRKNVSIWWRHHDYNKTAHTFPSAASINRRYYCKKGKKGKIIMGKCYC